MEANSFYLKQVILFQAQGYSSHSHNYIGLPVVILLLLLIHSHLFDVFHV